MQVDLLRQKLASEQQRARTAEASLAGQQQMQEVLQAAVQAVLHARGSSQVCPDHHKGGVSDWDFTECPVLPKFATSMYGVLPTVLFGA